MTADMKRWLIVVAVTIALVIFLSACCAPYSVRIGTAIHTCTSRTPCDVPVHEQWSSK